MPEFLTRLFSSDFMPHGYCYLWNQDILWLHAVSDSIITLAYYLIPLALLYFVRKRRDLPFHWMFLMFGVFIFGCGTTHLMEVWTLWHGTYRLAGVVKAITALASISTAAALVPLVPRALALPSPAQLRAANLELENEVGERRRAEEVLRKQGSLLELVHDAIIVRDMSDRITYWNLGAEETYGWRPQEALGKIAQELLGSDNPQDGETPKAAVIRRGKWDGELVQTRRDGRELVVSSRWGLQRDDQGNPTAILQINIDITEVKRTQQEALARQKLESIGVLAGGIAHDFNNLLGGILAETEYIEQDLPADSCHVEELHRIKESAIRGSEIVRELMIYSGQDKADPVELVDLSRLVENMLELLKVSISKHALLKTDLRQNLPAVLGRASQIRQIVMNLIINASEAIGEKGGVITITTSRTMLPREPDLTGSPHLPSGDYLNLEVSDTGGGMTEEVQAKVFDPFFSTKFTGRGLGLSVVQGIVRDHGGTINLVSAPGQGTKFEIFLLCASETTQLSHTALALASEEEHRLPPVIVLIVEDEGLLRLAVSKLLRKKGFSVIEASDGTAALDLLRAHKDDIDLLLLDVTLPGSPSCEVFEEARHLRPDLPVIVTSAYSKETAAALLGRRVESFIRKPFVLDQLIGLIRESLPS